MKTIHVVAIWFALIVGVGARGAGDSVAMLDPFTVTADRIEEFGFELAGPEQPAVKGAAPMWTVHFVMPNTAAAKAGLRPGDRVLKLDGQPVMRTWREWAQLRRRKRDAVAAGGSVTWSLETETLPLKEVRTVVLTVPTRPPRWGAAIWKAPEGRAPASVNEEGPLAAIARVVLDNGVWTRFGWPFVDARLPTEFTGRLPAPFLAFYWVLADESGQVHKITVSQLRGRTDVVLSLAKPGRPEHTEYLTSPGAGLGEAIAWPGRKPLAARKASAGFAAEVEFWTTRVGEASAQWPLERLPRDTLVIPKRD